MIAELDRRGHRHRESGAFLLAHGDDDRRVVSRVAYLDDLDPNCLTGSIHFRNEGYAKLWDICEREDLRVVADIHTHPSAWVGQSPIDADNPMVARRGHVALIAPFFASQRIRPQDLGVHVYLGENGWESHFRRGARRLVYVGRFA